MITLPTSEETRRKLQAAGWVLFIEDAGVWEKWLFVDLDTFGESYVTLVSGEPRFCGGQIVRLLEACAILGIAPQGYKLVPADSMAADIAEVLQAYDVDKVTAELEEFFKGEDEEEDTP